MLGIQTVKGFSNSDNYKSESVRIKLLCLDLEHAFFEIQPKSNHVSFLFDHFHCIPDTILPVTTLMLTQPCLIF